MKRKILVTGGAGYIGSHTVVDLLSNGYDVIIADNYSNSKRSVIESIKKIVQTGNLDVVDTNVADLNTLRWVFERHKPSSVIHFAAYKAVGESVKFPLLYYHNNINGLLNILICCQEFDVNELIFSSSCSVYGNTSENPISENTPLGIAASPYAYTKQVGESMILDLCKSNKKFKSIILRYFNPVGAHESSLIGEDSLDKPNNLVPIITGVAAGEFEKLTVFGNDYPTPDGTCIRDYIHVCDLAEAHRISLEKIDLVDNSEILNIGTGNGISVLEMINSFEKVTGGKLKYELGERREGDVISVYSDTRKSERFLNWKPKRDLDTMMISAWKWQNSKQMKTIEYYITTTNNEAKELVSDALNNLMDGDVDQKFSVSLKNKISDGDATHFTLNGTWHSYELFLGLTKTSPFSIEHFEE